MRTQKQNLGLVLLLVAVVATAVAANENPIQVDASKVKIIDNSRVLTKEEVDKMANKDAIPVVVPLLKKPPRLVEPKIGVVGKDDEVKSAVDQSEVDAKLPPMPLIMPPFFHDIFEQPANSEAAAAPGDASDADKSKGIVSVLLLKSHRVEDSSNPEGSLLGQPDEGNVKSTSFIILRYLPKSFGNLFGFDSDDSEAKLFGGDDDVDKKRQPHLLGGEDDVDFKRVHLLGGGDDPDRVRLNIDENNKGVFTGGNEDVFSNKMDQHRIFVFSMFDRLRSMFDGMRSPFDQSNQPESGEPSNIESVPFISIRTDDGQSALIPNDIGYAEKQQHEQSLNKCMMLQFMRLKASMYYRTILHLLFFTGVLLFIFSLVMLIVRACRRRQLARRHHHHHHHHRHHPHPHPHPHHANMSVASLEAGKSKLAAYKAWQGLDQSSLIEPSDKVVLIQAPPAYDQVFIHDKNSTLTSSAARQPFVGSCQTSDECETKSLPPEYDEKPMHP